MLETILNLLEVKQKNIMQTALYKKYANIRLEIAALEEQESLLKAEIMEDMQKSGNEKVDTDYGKFTVCVKKKWTYSKKVAKIEEELKIQKFTEQEKGIAKVEVTNYLAFKAPSEE